MSKATVIHKFILYTGHAMTIIWAWPRDAKPLYVAEQNGSPYVWVRLDPEAPPATWAITCAATGSSIDPTWGDYIGTATSEDGRYVWHYFAKVMA